MGLAGFFVVIFLVELYFSACFASNKVIYQKDIDIEGYEFAVRVREGEDVCVLLKKYISWTSEKKICRNVTLSRLQDILMQDLLTVPTILAQVVLDPNIFIDCTLPSSQVCEKQSYFNSWRRNRQMLLDSFLNVFRENEVNDETLQNFIDIYEGSRMKLTSIESVELFASAYTLRPNCSFVLNRFGQSLERVSNNKLKDTLYNIGVKRGVWPSLMQRPEMSYIPGLASNPWHNSTYFPFSQVLKAKYHIFKEELYNVLSSNGTMFEVEDENLNTFSAGEWTALVMKTAQGYSAFSSHLPHSTQILQNITENFLLVKYSALKPGTHILPHTGPSNSRLRAHFCITHTGGARIRVGEEWRTWSEGEVFILDSSFEHEVIHDGSDPRIILILDIWHPEYVPPTY